MNKCVWTCLCQCLHEVATSHPAGEALQACKFSCLLVVFVWFLWFFICVCVCVCPGSHLHTLCVPFLFFSLPSFSLAIPIALRLSLSSPVVYFCVTFLCDLPSFSSAGCFLFWFSFILGVSAFNCDWCVNLTHHYIAFFTYPINQQLAVNYSWTSPIT